MVLEKFLAELRFCDIYPHCFKITYIVVNTCQGCRLELHDLDLTQVLNSFLKYLHIKYF